MPRHAYLIAAYDNFHVLERLVRLLDHPQHNIYLHVDKKAEGFDESLFAGLCRRSRLVVMPRMVVHWGDYSQVESIMRMLRRALGEDDYAYVHLLSDSDLPLRPSSELVAFFAGAGGRDFLELGELTGAKRQWVSRWHPFNRLVRSPRPRVRVAHARVRRVSLALQRLGRVDRTRAWGTELRCGSDWYSITGASARRLLALEPQVRLAFRSTHIPTEFYVHTALAAAGVAGVGSSARDGEPTPVDGGNLRLIDFGRGAGRGNPVVWTIDDLPELVSSDRLFARKFDPRVDAEVIDRVVENVIARGER